MPDVPHHPKRSKRLTPALVIALTLPILIGSASAAISYTAISNDADCGITSANTYTHAIDFGASGSGATVNGQAFDRVSSTVASLGASPFLDYNGNGNTGESSNDGTNASVKSGNMAGLMQGFIYQDGSNSAPGDTQILTLSGLTAGITYDFRLYLGQWTAGASSRTTNITFDPDGAGAISESTGVFNIDNPTAIGIATDATYYVNYRYTATAEDLVVSAEIQVNNNSMHIYALTNQVVPEPSAALLVAMSSLLLLRRRR